MEMPTSALTGITLKDMFDAGLHFGHQTKRWNPKMKGYIFDKRNGIHIIDLQQSVEMLDEAAAFVRDTILAGKKILFVATKKQMAEMVKAAAVDVDQFYVTERWLGGTLTNAKTIRSSVKRMHQLQATAKANGGQLSEHKQENSMLRRELAKLEKNLAGIAEMAEQPGAVVIMGVTTLDLARMLADGSSDGGSTIHQAIAIADGLRKAAEIDKEYTKTKHAREIADMLMAR